MTAQIEAVDFFAFDNSYARLPVLSMPYVDQPAFGRYVGPPRPDQVVHQTFCGT
jgi:serine/tyrosine/threonine adenylyltransferase